MKTSHEKLWHRLFQIGVGVKAIDGFFETAGGLLFLFVSRQTILQKVFSLTRHELLEDPDDWMANHLRNGFTHLSPHNKIFAAAYLLGHGIVKLGLVWGLWREKLWAFPAAIVVLVGFVGYQIFRLVQHFSIGLCTLTVFDVFIILFVWREYRRLKGSHTGEKS